MKKFGLIGFPLGHSFSKNYFERKFQNKKYSNFKYDNYQISNVNDISKVLKNNPDIIGLNVTIPYKEKIIPYLDEIDVIAEEIGSVNTIRITDGRLIGYNTDYIGFKSSIIDWMPQNKMSALVLGSGGSSKAIRYALNELKINFKVVSRVSSTSKISYDYLKIKKLLNHYNLIINTTPLGMHPDIDTCPDLNFKYITSKHFVFDLVYNPIKTKLLSLSEERGAKIKNGYEMLVNQAELSWKIWNK